MKRIILAAAIATISSAAFAGSFDGPFVQLGIGGAYTSTKVTGLTTGSGSSADGTVSGGSVNGLVAAGYSQEIAASGFNLAANIFYVIGNQKSGSNSSTATNSSNYTASIGTDNKLENTFGISIEPGWNFSKETLGYVKLAWVNTQSKNSISFSNNDPSSSQDAANKNLNGFGYGLGIKQMISKDIFAGIDLMGVTYGSNKPGGDFSGSGFKPSQFLGFASVGYKF